LRRVRGQADKQAKKESKEWAANKIIFCNLEDCQKTARKVKSEHWNRITEQKKRKEQLADQVRSRNGII